MSREQIVFNGFHFGGSQDIARADQPHRQQITDHGNPDHQCVNAIDRTAALFGHIGLITGKRQNPAHNRATDGQGNFE